MEKETKQITEDLIIHKSVPTDKDQITIISTPIEYIRSGEKILQKIKEEQENNKT